MTTLVHPHRLWSRVAQAYAGMYFVICGYQLAAESAVGGVVSIPLRGVLENWLRLGLPAPGYDAFLQSFLPYSNALTVFVVLLQCIGGMSLVLNTSPRVGGWILLFVQVNILLATFHSASFLIPGALAVWIALYYVLEDGMSPRVWRWLSAGLMVIVLLWLRERALVGDMSPQSYAWQRESFTRDVMSVSPAVKQWWLWIMGGVTGPWLWAGVWWAQFMLVLAYAMPFLRRGRRLPIATALLLFAMLRAIVWTNAFVGDAVLHVLALLILVTHEYTLMTGEETGLRGWTGRAWKKLKEIVGA